MLTYDKKLTREELEEKPGIKAQHAVFRALKQILTRADTGWDVEETEPGSRKDRDGIDIYLVNRSQGLMRILDVAMRDKPESEDTLLRVYPDWFEENEDGSWTLRKQCEKRLIRALLPTMYTPHIQTGAL